MANAFQLRIVTAHAPLFEGPVRECTGPGSAGEFGVLSDHITFLTALEIGVMSFKTDTGVRKVAVRGGFAEVADNVMTVLTDEATFGEDVDPASARFDLQEAETQLQGLSPLDDAFAAADAARRWALARIDATR